MAHTTNFATFEAAAVSTSSIHSQIQSLLRSGDNSICFYQVIGIPDSAASFLSQRSVIIITSGSTRDTFLASQIFYSRVTIHGDMDSFDRMVLSVLNKAYLLKGLSIELRSSSRFKPRSDIVLNEPIIGTSETGVKIRRSVS